MLALQEADFMPATTLQYIVNQLNAIYGPGTYAYDTTGDPTDGNSTGNGPGGLIYNTHTVVYLGATVIGDASSSGSGALQSVIRSSRSMQARLPSSIWTSATPSRARRPRMPTAATSRLENLADAAALGPNADIIYSGDYNTTSSTEAGYKTMVAAGTGQAIDTVNTANNWTATAAFRGLFTESATNLEFRDDYQFVTGPMLNQNGLQLVPGTYTQFGNNGSTGVGSAVNLGSNMRWRLEQSHRRAQRADHRHRPLAGRGRLHGRRSARTVVDRVGSLGRCRVVGDLQTCAFGVAIGVTPV